jgi:hypothetical protein
MYTYPSPVRVVDNRSSNKRTNSHTNKVHRQHNGDIVASLSQRHQIGNNNVDDHIDASRPDALDGPSSNECGAVVGSSAQSATKQEESDDRHGQPPAAEYVGQLAEERLDRGTDGNLQH